jgi:NADPH:quinone reductase-like Zn-dependent oxidoreductase
LPAAASAWCACRSTPGRSTSGELEISLQQVAIPAPGPDEVVVRIEAAPINPSDLGLLLGAADPASAKISGSGASSVVTATVPQANMKAMGGRLDESMAVGNEGAGTVVKAGSSEAAQALLGKTVALIGGAMYAQYRVIKAKECLPLPEGTTATEGASCFVNPLTSLGMVETMKREGHTALVHTAAASNLGQMLNKICQKDGIDLVNIVRSEEQEKLLRGIGAKYVCNSTSPTFMEDLTAALIATNATLAFDATGGGKLQGQILQAMEVAAVKAMKVYSRYGSTTHKQVYVYGRLDLRPIEFVPPAWPGAWAAGCCFRSCRRAQHVFGACAAVTGASVLARGLLRHEVEIGSAVLLEGRCAGDENIVRRGDGPLQRRAPFQAHGSTRGQLCTRHRRDAERCPVADLQGRRCGCCMERGTEQHRGCADNPGRAEAFHHGVHARRLSLGGHRAEQQFRAIVRLLDRLTRVVTHGRLVRRNCCQHRGSIDQRVAQFLSKRGSVVQRSVRAQSPCGTHDVDRVADHGHAIGLPGGRCRHGADRKHGDIGWRGEFEE